MHPTAVADFAPPRAETRFVPPPSVTTGRRRRAGSRYFDATAIQRRLAFLLPLVVSVPVAWRLVLHYHSIYNDAESRLANAYYVFFSRDPHLAAIGFVWNPLPSVVDMPLLLLKGIWPALANEAFAANLTSCVLFALACYQMYRFLEELSVGPLTRWGLWTCFAANPLIFYYGVNGMSEMLFLFTLIITTRYLAVWLRSGGARPLVTSGFWLGVAYLARNEAVASALVAGPIVLVVSYLRARGRVEVRLARLTALTDFVLYIVPVVVSFAMWAIIAWLIVGQPFQQFSSVYGNASQIKLAGNAVGQATSSARLHFAIHGSQSIAPLLLPLVLVALAWGAWRRDWRVLAPVGIIVSVLLFEIVAYTGNQIFPWYRYYIYACPAIVMAAGCMAAPLELGSGLSRSMRRVPRLSGFVGLAAVLASGPGILTTANTLGTPGISNPDRAEIAYILWPHSTAAHTATTRQNDLGVKSLARQIDALHLKHGQIMVDNFTSCIPPLILDVKDPKEFSIPNDQDYQARLGVPYQFGVRYFLVPNPAGAGGLDALNHQFPGLYDSGQGLAVLDKQITVPGCPTFRLYKVLPGAGK